MGISNTPPIARTKIIEPMLFVDYPKQGIAFLVGLGNNPLRWSPKDFLYSLREILHSHRIILGKSNTPPIVWTKIK